MRGNWTPWPSAPRNSDVCHGRRGQAQGIARTRLFVWMLPQAMMKMVFGAVQKWGGTLDDFSAQIHSSLRRELSRRSLPPRDYAVNQA